MTETASNAPMLSPSPHPTPGAAWCPWHPWLIQSSSASRCRTVEGPRGRVSVGVSLSHTVCFVAVGITVSEVAKPRHGRSSDASCTRTEFSTVLTTMTIRLRVACVSRSSKQRQWFPRSWKTSRTRVRPQITK